MSGTAKTVLLVAGIGVGAFLLLKVFAPSPASLGKPTRSNTDSISVAGITGLLSGLGGLLGGGGGGSSSSQPTAADLSAIGFDTNNYTTSNGFEYTDAAGHFIAG